MPCYTPLEGYMTLSEGLVFNPKHPGVTHLMTVSCGQCIGCRLERSRQWAIRCVHEASLHENTSFVTLTYDDDNLPYGSTLHRPDFQKFMKRLIKKHGPTRLFYCGEYGDETHRPHYHACLFGYRPNDPELFSVKNEIKTYESKDLRKIWGLGHATFGDLNFETAAYTARYITKKITGKAAQEHYETCDPETGEITTRTPEFNGMSRRPGIGLKWLEKYGQDTYSKDEIILRDRAMKPPRAYDKQFEHNDPQTWSTVKSRRTRLNHLRTHPLKHSKGDGRDHTIHNSRRNHAGNIIANQKLQKKDL